MGSEEFAVSNGVEPQYLPPIPHVCFNFTDNQNMKRIVVFVRLVFSAFGLVYAQSSGGIWNIQQSPGYRPENSPPRRTISGVLGVSRGMVTLNDKNGAAWYVPGLDRYIGFINGLDLGEAVTLEGYASSGSSQEKFFQVTKFILDGISYEFAPPPEIGQAPVRPGKGPAPEQSKGLEHRHYSPWFSTDPIWMQGIDLNAIWKEDSKFWQGNGKKNRDD
jgi:hypothetical protein